MDILFESIGWAGTGSIVAAYHLVSCGKLRPDSAVYHFLNLGGALAVGASAFPKQAWPAVGLEIIWAGIALTALFRIFRGKTRPA